VFVALVTQYAKRMRRIILSAVARLALPYFPTLSHKRHDFWGEKVIEHTMCVLILSTAFFWNISHSKKNPARYYHTCTQVLMWSIRYSCQILMKHEFSWQIFDKCSNIKFHGSPVGASCCMRTDGRTDRESHDEPSSRFSLFCERASKVYNT
jgi:hypothetical protein